MTETETLSRTERRKLRTRQALVTAAQQLLAEERTAVSVLEITTLADVGNGSFYNHFATKEELFDAAVLAVIDEHGAAMDRLTEGITDPAEAFTQSFRMTGRLHRRMPSMSRIVVNSGPKLLASNTGLLPRARRDITAAIAAGRFRASDPELALTIASGAALSLAVLLLEAPERDDAAATDAVTAQLLRGFGLTESETTSLIELPLPEPIL
ncbi:Transcriptional regulator, TetR family OS=Tsukamurella paurometabola (strain ATCC 8368 / DSM/ CCUG 35730 / CIP 100753 / JCM 10117 / KCTC 9821 / NBRC 16120/ NCIMB 702349 / NCTC 13040) OX=521096 GN=Tpau_2817 PE=4 SV=1 [Tsukamurella paurometabola]|uniref:Transcriptional regulator, TetR family n=1 Tax=Tsukamurella paurometabola (strain ATCC 8368 / DSM 20162 / CCUG 35730 / CIP 100753 / JCM 10117 / KCTC 9821 / NBRC 16120 / NCIMB 702349 / NCTC 13040) TaxID=521096 RepID=D5UTD0_TSUPD|nr:TetR/AcrR family transcriptional regulator [Tsukamurella paurometabola]ADG79415.1 transcriptional regulator, TetR family [Tsukamurella paurometabola DSM 20162]SUP35631.1 DNA-binding transcriptional repressor FabR [Tsukamurella paurometabola]